MCIERDEKREQPHGRDATMVVYSKVTEFDKGMPIDVSRPVKEVVEEICDKVRI